MPTRFPTKIDDKVPPTSTMLTNIPIDVGFYGSGHAALHIFSIDAITALEDKVGIDDSLDETTHDFKLQDVISFLGDKAASRIRLQQQNYTYADDTGSADNYIITLTPDVIFVNEGARFQFKAANTNTGSSKIQVGLTMPFIPLVKDISSPLVAGDIVANKIYDIVYDGSNFVVELSSGTDQLVKVNATDTTPDYLDPKINIHSSNSTVLVNKTIINPGGDEVLDYDLTIIAGGSVGIIKPKHFDYSHLANEDSGGSSVSFYHDIEAYFSTFGGNTEIKLEIPGQDLQVYDFSIDLPAISLIQSIVILNSFMYVYMTDGLNQFIFRYDVNNIVAGGTAVTPDVPFGATIGGGLQMTSDGTDMLFNFQASNSANSNIVSRYSISGTNLTHISDTTCGVITSAMDFGVAVDIDGNFYGFKSSDGTISKFDKTGALLTSNIYTTQSNLLVTLENWGNVLYARMINTGGAAFGLYSDRMEFPGMDNFGGLGESENTETSLFPAETMAQNDASALTVIKFSEATTPMNFGMATAFEKGAFSVYGNNRAMSSMNMAVRGIGLIAFDTSTDSGYDSAVAVNPTLTWSHTCSGSDRILLVSAFSNTMTVSGITYNGVPMTLLDVRDSLNIYYLINPDLGANNIVVQFMGVGAYQNGGQAASYTGVDQTTPIDSTNFHFAPSDTTNISTTVVGSGCWLVGFVAGNSANSPTSDRTDRQSTNNGANLDMGLADSNGIVASGSESMQFIATGSTGTIGIIASLLPALHLSDNYIIRIETDNAGAPSGVLANPNATATIAGNTLTSSFVDTTINFAGSFTLSGGQPYWIVASRDGGLDDNNFYQLGYSNAGARVFEAQTFDGIAWNILSTLVVSYANGNGFSWITKSEPGLPDSDNFFGFASANIPLGSSGKFITGGTMSTFSGLQAGEIYETSSGGSISTSGSIRVGKALQDNILLVVQPPL